MAKGYRLLSLFHSLTLNGWPSNIFLSNANKSVKDVSVQLFATGLVYR